MDVLLNYTNLKIPKLQVHQKNSYLCNLCYPGGKYHSSIRIHSIHELEQYAKVHFYKQYSQYLFHNAKYSEITPINTLKDLEDINEIHVYTGFWFPLEMPRIFYIEINDGEYWSVQKIYQKSASVSNT